MLLGPASKHIPHTRTKTNTSPSPEEVGAAALLPPLLCIGGTIPIVSSMLKSSIQQLVSLSKHTFHWHGISFHQKIKVMNFMLNLSYMTEAVKLKAKKKYSQGIKNHLSTATVQEPMYICLRELNCPTRVLQQFSNQVKSPRSSFGHI
jgi:hypothetical protein